MGLSSKKTKQKTTPVYSRQIEGAANTIGSVYGQQAPKVAGYADQIGSLVPDLVAKARAGDAGVDAARNYNVSVLQGQYLDGNPYLDQVISDAGDDTRNQLQAALGARGLTGGSSYADIISRNVGKMASGLRYQDYDAERARMATAAGQSPGIAAGDVVTIAPALAAAGAASELPLNAALKYGSGVGGLLGQYTNTTQKSSPGFMDILGTGLQAASLFSDERLKEDKKRVGETDDGLPIYTYRYKGGGPTHMGVMAQDVKKKKPRALGPIIDRYMTVDYSKVA